MNDPQRLAAAAPVADGDDDNDEQLNELDPLHQMCEDWAAWVRTRRFYARPSLPPSILGKLRSPTRATGGDYGPNAICSAELAAFNLAIEQQPIDALDRKVFELHYRWRIKPIKTFADALGISRSHWYVLLRAFEQRAHSASLEILERNLAEARALTSAN